MSPAGATTIMARRRHPAVQVRRLWTDNRAVDNEPVTYIRSRSVRYVYVDHIMVHDFGHALGLDDFYAVKTMDHLDAVMNGSLEIRDEDIAQLKAIYFHHDPH